MGMFSDFFKMPYYLYHERTYNFLRNDDLSLDAIALKLKERDPTCVCRVKDNKELFFGYVFDNELIIVNGLITFIGLLLISKPAIAETRF